MFSICCVPSSNKSSPNIKEKNPHNNNRETIPYLQPQQSTYKIDALKDVAINIDSISSSNPPSPSSPSSTVKRGSELYPTTKELDNPSMLLQKLFFLDSNRLKPQSDYHVNIDFDDNKDGLKLFRFMNEAKIYSNPIYKHFIDLINSCTSKETNLAKREVVIDQFVKLLARGKIGKLTQNIMVSKRVCSNDPTEFCTKLKHMWFTANQDGLTNFERVFTARTTSDNKVHGMTNWLFLYLMEKDKQFEYMGNVKPEFYHHLMTKPKGTEPFMSVKGKFKGVAKNKITGFMGCSPEYEMCLYTLMVVFNLKLSDISIQGVDCRIVVEVEDESCEWQECVVKNAFVRFDYS